MFLVWIVLVGVLLITGGLLVGFWKREKIKRLLVVHSLFRENRIVSNFSNMAVGFLHKEIPKGEGPVSPLPQGAPMSM
ncbi:MAG: 6-aminohexanoate hydrolase, partial [Pseudomonadota bacterium]